MPCSNLPFYTWNYGCSCIRPYVSTRSLRNSRRLSHTKVEFTLQFRGYNSVWMSCVKKYRQKKNHRRIIVVQSVSSDILNVSFPYTFVNFPWTSAKCLTKLSCRIFIIEPATHPYLSNEDANSRWDNSSYICISWICTTITQPDTACARKRKKMIATLRARLFRVRRRLSSSHSCALHSVYCFSFFFLRLTTTGEKQTATPWTDK